MPISTLRIGASLRWYGFVRLAKNTANVFIGKSFAKREIRKMVHALTIQCDASERNTGNIGSSASFTKVSNAFPRAAEKVLFTTWNASLGAALMDMMTDWINKLKMRHTPSRILSTDPFDGLADSTRRRRSGIYEKDERNGHYPFIPLEGQEQAHQLEQ